MYRPVSTISRRIDCLSWFFGKIVIDVRILDCTSRPAGLGPESGDAGEGD
jgi:hypothetical protein